ncbi:hypothetical protein HanXRQr2_Chr12g0551061 [Helianthus annuus]|nr:hypothetical protein HanXRQr2_Chr12g0551061 [Helianthus annuus]KAJ0506021.1 hypothetical protein HanHA89_Chr12g0477121 [Helianthus annuus]KAJ0675691.1 hypothetical protein HanLR1_Chr12g0454011 [Helianthus annuus]KAJ0678962.1 hypothetical protein HanOQP8_Chr12g0453841 [Helianthus annuus]KAJ0863484.1 hypothetical protein HanPSC8_Chr12g0530531 [Helianthus annuus]
MFRWESIEGKRKGYEEACTKRALEIISHENQRGCLNRNHEIRKELTSRSPITRFNWGGRKAKVIKSWKRVNDVRI